VSWVRRFDVRDFEWRRLGFGIVCILSLRFDVPERSQPRVFPSHVAVTGARIEVRAAIRAQPFAVGLAQRLHWQRELKLLQNQVIEGNLICVVERSREIVLFDLCLTFADVFGARDIPQIEIRCDGHRERFEASAARELYLSRDAPRNAKTPWLLPVDIERQNDRRDDSERVTLDPREERGLEPLVEVGVCVL
jgi:hypothetical protein